MVNRIIAPPINEEDWAKGLEEILRIIIKL